MRPFEGYKRGINLGGWLSQRRYDEEYINSFIGEEDFARIASWGLDHVRVPVDYPVVQTEEGEYKPTGFAHIADAIAWCRKYNLKMVLDLHKTAGFVFDTPDYVGFFSDPALQERFCQLWEKFATEFGNNADMLTFELLNEVTEPAFSDTWNRVAREAIQRIRAITPDIKIMVGGYWNGSIDALYDLEIPTDKNVVFTFHCYDPILFTHQSAYWVKEMTPDFHMAYPGTTADYREQAVKMKLDYMMDFKNVETETLTADFFINRWRRAVEYCEAHDIPLYCGEYGVIDKAPAEDTVRWFRDMHTAFEKFDLPRAVWSYKEMDYGLIGEHYAPVVDEIIKLL